jgi:flagellar FliJ protein
MQSFKFRLETLLKFRKMQKEQAQIAFWQATNQFRIEKEELTKLQGKLSENISLLRTFQQQLLSIETFKTFHYYFDKIKEEISKQENSVKCADEYRQKCLIMLEEAVKNHKVVEKFRDKKFQKYQIDLIKEEQKMLDEIGLQLYVREK